MKMKIIFLSLIVAIIVSGCKEDYIGQYPVNSTPPPSVSNIRMENFPGSVKLTYDLPEIDDLLYVKAVYTNTRGERKEMSSSAYSNSIVLIGFGKGQKRQVALITVDKSYNESSPVTVEIEPLDSPIYEVFQSLQAHESFGGVTLSWDNPLREDVILEAMMKDKEDGEYKYIETIYSSESMAVKSIRGLEDIATDFAFYFRDIYNNYTDTLYTQLTPIYEEEFDKSKFVPLRLSSKFVLHSYGGGKMQAMWDNIYNVDGNLFYVNIATEPIYFSFDMGINAKLSRFRLWTRRNYIYQLHHIRKFEIWGTNDVAATQDPDSWDGWTKIMDCESIRPSGAVVGGPPTAEEEQHMLAGEEWEVPLDAPSFRYMRFKVNQTWSNSAAAFINEITIWGSTKQ